MSRPVRIIAGIFLILILLAAAVGGFFWWKISGLKEALIHNLGDALGAHVEVASLSFDLWKGELHAASITLTNDRPSAPWDKGNISQAAIRFHLRDIFSPTLPLEVDVSSWNVTLRPYGNGSTETPSTSTATTESTEPPPASAPAKVVIQVTKLTARDGSVEIDLSGDKKVMLRGVAFEADNNGANIWTTELQASSVVAGPLEAAASSVDIRGEPGQVTFSNLRLACGQGFLTGEGQVSLTSPHALKFDLKATDVPVAMLVAVEWQMKLSGLANGTLHYEGDDTGGTAQGQLAVSQGKFNILPWLGKVTALVSLPDISNVELDKATTDFSWKAGTLHLTNLDIRKNDVTRFAGTVDIDSTDQIDGRLKLGLPSAITAKWPDLQTKIFSVKFEDYNWTEVHLTGTPDHLQEDLTPRLLAEGLQEGSGLLDQATKKATDLYKSFMGN